MCPASEHLIYLFRMSFCFDTTKDLSLFKRGHTVPGPYFAQSPGTAHPIFRSPAVSPCSTYNLGIYIYFFVADSVL